ncbi:MAG: DNA alkylation repair protein [Candidatus Omnitrophica bacterium]|nr:DNA alkylation repair protein [Candidatus Omnitrophota bacterium]
MSAVIAARAALRTFADREKAKILQGFFKTGPGEYGEGDVFIGVKVPEIRRVARDFKEMGMDDIIALLQSAIHEERMLALLIAVGRYQNSDAAGQARIYRFYLAHTQWINNWDLVDVTVHHIVGHYLRDKDRQPLYALARSSSLWERRIAIVATYFFIRRDEFSDTLALAELLLADREDLLHKAVGWMLREVGKRDGAALEDFLKRHASAMPRTMLRYAIEKFPETQRRAYLARR